ncbi:ribonuclease D [Fluviicoccus keumensis]|uniref:Ribonuclease D n=1 Tax=Fluviicoccus keumensis TaxID=1435465 RepID=A0A4Q7ZAK0_9GAMM|nr:ribonuclease D [Fluviicoccus keumensis]RZU46925.1 ribonuclease D [Fluviicoccus keumensis]
MSWELITDQQLFQQRVRSWTGAGRLALDTEFIRVDTFNPRAALIQVNDGRQVSLADPLALDIAEFGAVLADPATLKIFHACSEDIEVFNLLFPKQRITRVFDTQIGLAFLGYGNQVGYQKALQECLDIAISKAETRSDWLMRPLTPEQQQYAALDVEYLFPLYDFIRARLVERGLLEWCEADCALIMEEMGEAPDMRNLYLSFSNAWKFTRQQLALLQMLTIWREGAARIHNIPRTFVLKNHTLLDIVERWPHSLPALSRIQDLHPRTYQKHGQMILQLVKQAEDKPIGQCPPLLPLPLPRAAKSLYDRLRAVAEAVAVQHHIPAEVLLRKKWLDSLVLGYVDFGASARLPSALTGWRHDILTRPLLEVLADEAASVATWRRYRHREDS